MVGADQDEGGLPKWDERYLEYRPNHRTSLYIRALLYVPPAIILTALLILSALSLPGTLLIVIFVGIGALAIDIEAIQAVRDLFATPLVSRGRIERRWSKGRSCSSAR